MADTTFERSPRAMSPSPSPGPAYVGRHRAGDPPRTGARTAARGLVILGLAGAAWLLSSSVAQAAGDVPGPPVDSVSTAGVQVSGAPAETDPLPTLIPRPEPATVPADGTPPVGTPPGATAPEETGKVADRVTTGAAGDGRDGALTRDAAGPVDFRPVDFGPDGAETRATPDAPTVTPGPGTPDSGSVARPGVTTGPVGQTGSVGVPLGGPPRVPPVPEAVATSGGKASGITGGRIVTRSTTSRRDVGAAGVVVPDAGRPYPRGTHHVPQFPRPAPAPAYPITGMCVAVPGVGSCVNQGGDLQAVPPAATVNSAVADHGSEVAVLAEVRRLIAESPMVSPD